MIHARKDYNEDKMKSIPENEPVFLLRAQDKTASEVVRYWATLQPDGPLKSLALKHVNLMDAWPIKKVSDL